MRTYVCPECATSWPIAPTVWRCSCGSPLDLSPLPPGPVVVDEGERSLWRYRASLPFAAPADPGAGRELWRAVTLGEGVTPLVSAETAGAVTPLVRAETAGTLGEGPGGADVRFKLDFLMPTLSYKDRGAAVLVTRAAEMDVKHLVADSSGNAGVAIAAYAARAGIAAEVFVPAATSAKKVGQLRAFGATVRQVEGSRTDAAAAAIERVESSGAFYASHVYNPFFLEGTKTFAYEVWEQLGRQVPTTVVVPAGNGTLLLGAALGFAELVAAGAAPEIPRLVAVQSSVCDPVAAAWAGRDAVLHAWTTTVAEGIAIPAPPRLGQMVEAVRASGGVFLTAGDDQILAARAELWSRGIDVEPTAAAVWAAWRAWPEAASIQGPVVIALSGAGLKAA
jgi:threonine synthase